MTAEDQNIETRSRFRLRFSLLALFIFVTLVCFLLAWMVQKKQVAATALFRVSSRPPTLLDDDAAQPGDENEYRVFQETQRALLKSYFVLNAAVRKPGIAKLAIFRGQKEPLEQWLKRHLEVNFPNDGEILQIRLHGTEAQSQDLIRIVDAVANAYNDEVVFKDRSRQTASRDLLMRSLDDLKKKIGEKSRLWLAIMQDSGRHHGAAAEAFRQLNLDRLERVDLELMRLENEQLKQQGGNQEAESKFYEARLAQLHERQAELEQQLAEWSEPSLDLNVLKADIEVLQQTANELEISLQKSAIDQSAPPRIEQIHPAVIAPAD